MPILHILLQSAELPSEHTSFGYRGCLDSWLRPDDYILDGKKLF